jgi:flagellin-like hook-associated protein FlgL
MPNNPKSIEERLRRVTEAWERLAPTKSFGGMTLAQFKAVTDPSRTIRQEIEGTETHLKSLYADREHADDVSLANIQLAVNGVLADPTEGADSALYEAFGYTPKRERKSGLTRKSNKTPAK